MPFSVLLEIALQPCGWLAAYCGSALTSTEDLTFRNLGGKATQLRPVTPDERDADDDREDDERVELGRDDHPALRHARSRRSGDVYKGTTYFGFFTKAALANQVGIRDAKVPWPSEAELMRAPSRAAAARRRRFPAPMLRMVDRIDCVHPRRRAEQGLGLVVGRIAVDPEFWFFKAHFYQDPVWPGSLGLESFLQLLKFVAWKRWGDRRQAAGRRSALGSSRTAGSTAGRCCRPTAK